MTRSAETWRQADEQRRDNVLKLDDPVRLGNVLKLDARAARPPAHSCPCTATCCCCCTPIRVPYQGMEDGRNDEEDGRNDEKGRQADEKRARLL